MHLLSHSYHTAVEQATGQQTMHLLPHSYDTAAAQLPAHSCPTEKQTLIEQAAVQQTVRLLPHSCRTAAAQLPHRCRTAAAHLQCSCHTAAAHLQAARQREPSSRPGCSPPHMANEERTLVSPPKLLCAHVKALEMRSLVWQERRQEMLQHQATQQQSRGTQLWLCWRKARRHH
jgi:hypothetical protein